MFYFVSIYVSISAPVRSVLTHYYKAEPVNYEQVLADALEIADILKAMVVDVTDVLE